MSTRQARPHVPLRSRAQLGNWFAQGERPAEQWNVGVEHEMFLLDRRTLAPAAYDGPRGIEQLLADLAQRDGWLPFHERGRIVALQRQGGVAGTRITLEAGGQLELSGDQHASVHGVFEESHVVLCSLKGMADARDLGCFSLGVAPQWTCEQMARVPKRRYEMMARYLPAMGPRALDAMYRTCSIQVNLDFADEADQAGKLRIALALQPVAAAMFASSPFADGRPVGLQSLRGEIWRHTDPERTGLLPFVFEPGMGYQRYIDYALDVPMLFVARGADYLDANRSSFRHFMNRGLQTPSGTEEATLEDWEDHLSTLYPEVRLRPYIEMRGADGGPPVMAAALAALWVGLLYDDQARNTAREFVADWTSQERNALRQSVPAAGLAAPFRDGTVHDLAWRMVDLAGAGLARRRRLDHQQRDEQVFLEPLRDLLERRSTRANELLCRYHGPWATDIRKIYESECF